MGEHQGWAIGIPVDLVVDLRAVSNCEEHEISPDEYRTPQPV